MRRILLLLVAPAMVFFFAGLVFAPDGSIPHLINYQGMLTDSDGNPLNGEYDLTFKICSQSSGGTALWTETHSQVSVEKGLFNVTLGDNTSGGVPSLVFSADERYVGVKVGTDDELSPRTRLTSVGYAYRAEIAESDGDWTISGSNIYSTVSGNVGIGKTTPQEKLDVNGTVQMTGFKMPTGVSNGYVLTSDGSGVGSWQAPSGQIGGSGGLNYIPKFTSSNSIGNSVIHETGFLIGIGTTSPKNRLDVEGAMAVGTSYSGTNTAPSNGMIIEGNVGIGKTSPSEKLDVNGWITVAGAFGPWGPAGGIKLRGDAVNIYGHSSNTVPTLYTLYLNAASDASVSDAIVFVSDNIYSRKDGGSSWVKFDNINERVGIGTTNPTTKLTVAGLTGTTSYYNLRYRTSDGAIYYYSSSKRYKDDIQPLEGDFDRILKAEPKSFIDKVSGERNIGFIAEEFDELGLDNLVTYRDGQPDALKYELVSLYLLEIVKGLKSENEELKQRIETLEGNMWGE